jgi:hypothetical protein
MILLLFNKITIYVNIMKIIIVKYEPGLRIFYKADRCDKYILSDVIINIHIICSARYYKK